MQSSPPARPASLPLGLRCRAARIDAITTPEFYRIARLRQEVFAVEQDCVYVDLDGRDLEPQTTQLWAETLTGEVVSALRILDETAHEPGLVSIGRVVTDARWRGRGISAALIQTAIVDCAGRPIRIHAQSHLADWYARFGFIQCGPEFLEDRIPHVPMRREADPPTSPLPSVTPGSTTA